jgi:putative glycosyltransferase (TIGR04348 family)
MGRVPYLRPLRIRIVHPERGGLPTGNQVTAQRWGAILRELGHTVTAHGAWTGQPCDLLVALHARKSHRSIARFRRAHPDRPLVVALTGTDLYRDVRSSRQARASLDCASRLVVLQPRGVEALPPAYRAKAHVIRQSARRPPHLPGPRRGVFQVCVLAHLRGVKDPFRVARAARLLPPSSKMHIVHAGAALDPGMARTARAEEAASPRYHWAGPLSRARALRLLTRSRLLVITSRLEGGANVLVEALACRVPVITSRIDGVIGTLGEGYPGYFPVGGTRALARLLRRFETDTRFRAVLTRQCRRVAPLVAPAHERRGWRTLLEALGRHGVGTSGRAG